MDTDALSLGGLGLFLASGSFWLLIENLLQLSRLEEWSVLMTFCAIIVAVGLTLMVYGGRIHRRKRGRIDRIFEQATRQEVAGDQAASGINAKA